MTELPPLQSYKTFSSLPFFSGHVFNLGWNWSLVLSDFPHRNQRAFVSNQQKVVCDGCRHCGKVWISLEKTARDHQVSYIIASLAEVLLFRRATLERSVTWRKKKNNGCEGDYLYNRPNMLAWENSRQLVRHYWLPCEMGSEERVQKFHTVCFLLPI